MPASDTPQKENLSLNSSFEAHEGSGYDEDRRFIGEKQESQPHSGVRNWILYGVCFRSLATLIFLFVAAIFLLNSKPCMTSGTLPRIYCKVTPSGLH